jgi:hypothetical protein
MDCAVIHARTSLTFQHVTRSDNLMGLGKVPAATLRHRVGALNGNGAGCSGRLGLSTSCASRTNALSGSASNTECWIAGLCAGMLDAIGALGEVGLCDTSRFLSRKPEFVLTASKCHYPNAGHPGLCAKQTCLFASNRGIL